MRKVIAGINMTLDGDSDHTAVVPDAEIHDHYTTLLKSMGTALYGRVTYELMKFWILLAEKPTGVRSMDEFAVAMDRIPKLVFSSTLIDPEWHSARLATRSLKEEVQALRQEEGKDILVGSPGLITSLAHLGLVDEFQFCVHPVISGKRNMPLFQRITERIELRLIDTKTFRCGAIILYYAPAGKGGEQKQDSA